MVINVQAIIMAYLVPIILGVILVVGILVSLSFISRLGRSDDEEDPASRAVRRRRGQG